MKFVYVLVSSENDYYYEECVVSITSLLRRNPSAHIVLLIDDKTQRTLISGRKEIKELASEVIVQEFDVSVKQKVRSRLLKTSMRQLVQGDFLYIDTDTVIADNLNSIENFEYDLGMVLDMHMPVSNNHKQMYENAKRLKYSVGYNNLHFNSGVIWVRDTLQNRAFFKMWNELYKETLIRGIDIDQASLNEVNCRMGGIIAELSGVWNVQVNCGVKFLAYAKIIHYLGFQPKNKQAKYFTALPFELSNVDYLDEMKENGKITKKINAIIEEPKTAFTEGVIIPRDSITYIILHSNHMRVLKFIYVELRTVYCLLEKIYGYIFKKIFKRV